MRSISIYHVFINTCTCISYTMFPLGDYMTYKYHLYFCPTMPSITHSNQVVSIYFLTINRRPFTHNTHLVTTFVIRVVHT